MKITELDIFDYMYEHFKFDTSKPIRLFEAFSGIGTQHMALKRLAEEKGFEVELVGISEIDKFAIEAYEAIHGEAKNYGGIGEFDTLPPNIDIATWSFPCQDISLAGRQQGMVEGSRSNYGYTFLDTIERSRGGQRPKVLLMENVTALFSERFKDDWREIQLRLERMGYKNYADKLIATDYGIPQTRDRVFIVSILGDYNYDFPRPIELKKKLSDYLEKEVEEKYFLSDKMIDYMTGVNQKESKFPRGERFFSNIYRENQEVANTITTSGGTRPTDNFVLIPEATKRGFKEAYEGDGVYINRPHQKRGVVQTDKIQTLKTQLDVGVVVKDTRNQKELLADKLLDEEMVKEGDVINHSYASSRINKDRPAVESDNGLMPTLTTRVDTLGVVVTQEKLRIRKLTPREAWRLMGITDQDFEKARAVMSDAQLYKQAGNAIVVDVLYHIFKQMI